MVQRAKRRDNGSGSISYDAQARRWIGLVDLGRGPDGRRRRTKVRGSTRSEVRTKLDQLVADRAAGVDLTARTTTFDKLTALWLERGVGDDLSDNTRANYERILRVHVLPTLGRTRVPDLRSEHVDAMLDAMQSAGKAGTTMRHALNLTRRVLRFGVARDVVARNVAEPVLPRRGPRAVRTGLSPDQARALLEAARNDRLGNLLTVSLLLGLRPGEAAGLTWSCVALDADVPTVAITTSLRRDANGVLRLASTKTPTSRRRLQAPAPVAEALHDQARRQQEDRRRAGRSWQGNADGLVFTTEIGTPLDPSNVRRSFARIARAAGLEHVHPHLLRHAAASLLSAAGVGLEDISDTLGHRSVTVTAEIYRHPIAPVRSGHIDAMNGLTATERWK